MTSNKFRLVSPFRPAGDQPEAIDALVKGINSGLKNQVLLGITGSGKTYTMAAVIEKLNRPVLVMSPNKVLAAQLYAEFKAFFPENAVEYFISYYDYYQPEAYIPQSDTYIEKDASINEHIDKLRLKATASLLSRRDVIVVASVSCIYNIGSPQNFSRLCLQLKTGAPGGRKELLDRLVETRYERNETEFAQGNFRAKGNRIDVFPAYSENALRIEVSGNAIGSIKEFHPLTGDTIRALDRAWIYPATHFVSTTEETGTAIAAIEKELAERIAWFKARDKPLEAERIAQRTRYDIDMMREVGYCHGIENYSRHLAGRGPGERPLCLLDYFPGRVQGSAPSPQDFLMFIDESHVSVPQIRGMYAGDRARKQVLADFGFRLPSAIDNRPLRFDEFEYLMPQSVFVSATPGPYELNLCSGPLYVPKSPVTGSVSDRPVSLRLRRVATGYRSPGKELRESPPARTLADSPNHPGPDRAPSGEPSAPKALRWGPSSPCIVEQIIRPTGLIDPPVSIFPSRGQLQHLMGEIEKRAKKKERTLVLALTKKTAEDLASYLAEKGLRTRYIHSDIATLDRLKILKELRKGSFDALIGINLLREGLDLPEVS
ncbi:MAG: DEAD/DEAH box helicase family protein, partial [bacterium]